MIAQTPWVERTFQFDFPVGLFPVIFSRLEGAIFRLHSLLLNADEEYSSFSVNGWSVKQHVGHLYDMEELWWKRLNDYRQAKTELTAADMTNAKTEGGGHNEKTLEHLLQQFTVERQKILEAVYDLGESALCITAMHPRLKQPMRLIDSLYFVAEHDDHHVSHISNLLRKPTDKVY